MRAKVALVVAIVLGLVAVLGIRSLLVKQRTQVEVKLREVEVLAASQSIKRGTALTYKMWEPRKIPEGGLVADHILYGERLRFLDEVLNRNVEQGEVILKSYFREVSLEVGTTLPPGQMAATLRVDDVGGVAGLIRPGDHVDVIGTLPLPARAAGGGGEVTTRRLLTNCTVLAVDNRTAQTLPSTTSYGRGALPYSTVTLIVSAREAALLAFVQSQGKITLSLRNRTDAAEADEPPEIGLQNVRDEAVRANAERKAKQAATDPSRP